MNKKIGMIVAMSVGALVLGLGIYKSDASHMEPKLSEENIRDLVSAQYPGEITELELEKELDRVFYEVEVAGESKEYDMELDGDTGEVLEIREKEMTSKQEETNDETDSMEMEKQRDNDSEAEDRDENREENRNTNRDEDRNNDLLTIVQIEEIALSEFAGMVKEIELEKEDGRFIYEVEIKNENREEAELDIDAYTGDILKIEKEFKTGGNNKNNKYFNQDILSIAQVKEIALNEFSGAIVELELEKEDGRLVYEVEVKNKGREAEMDIDAKTGNIIELEIEND